MHASPTATARAAATAMAEAHALPCVLDIEASGCGRAGYSIKVSDVLPDGRAACMLVRPPPTWTHWDASAELVHGITRGVLAAHGRAPLDVAAALNRDLAGLTVYRDGCAHDCSWLSALYEKAGLQPSFKLESVSALLDEPRLTQLDAARRAAIADMGLQRHRASNDARALQCVPGRVSAAPA